MTVEASWQPEYFWHVWYAPTGLSRDEAHRYFLSRIKPRDYTFEKFQYDHKTGRVMTA